MQKRSMTIICLYILLFSLVRTQQEGYGADNNVNLQAKNNANTNGTMKTCQKKCKKPSLQRHNKYHPSHQGLFSSDKLPTFTWLHDQTSPDGVPLLAIKFPDGKPDDVAILKKFNPIQRQPHERNENIDKCLFVGHLRDEPSAHVTLTGGCPFEDKLNIIMFSERSPIKMFSMSNGVVTPITSVFGTKDIGDIVIVRSAKKKQTLPVTARKAYTYAKINAIINIDQTFLSQFGAASFSVVNRLVLLANAWFRHPSLGSLIDFVYHKGLILSEKIEASPWNLLHVNKFNLDQYNVNVYMCYQNNSKGMVGAAHFGTICGKRNRRTVIVEYHKGDLKSAQILAHEVGHILGMDHDFNETASNPRYDSRGCCCTYIGGVMDYSKGYNYSHWTTCSVEDYQNTNTECLEHY